MHPWSRRRFYEGAEGGENRRARTYKDTGALSPTTAFTDTIVAKSSGTISNGVILKAGDITLRYQSCGADYLKIVRPSGQMLITTYLAKPGTERTRCLITRTLNQSVRPHRRYERCSR
jgi:hypothetical protein